jgi:elongation factor P
MLAYNEIIPKKVIILDGEPYEVIASHVFRKQQRKPVNQTKLRNLKTGKVTERSFHQAEKADEAELTLKEVTFEYQNRGEYWFSNPENPRERFQLPADAVGPAGVFLKAKTAVEIIEFSGEIIGVKVPIKMELAVKSTPPGVRGNTAQGGSKQATLETGATVTVPLFVNDGDLIRVNTEMGTYVERVEKS